MCVRADIAEAVAEGFGVSTSEMVSSRGKPHMFCQLAAHVTFYQDIIQSGRPKGVTPKFSLKPLVPRLPELLGLEVVMAPDCIGGEVEKLAAALPDGSVLLLENVRFYKEEEKNDPEFAKKLASVADLYVNDAFCTAHRAHSSTEGVTKFLRPSLAGLLMQKVWQLVC
ncbi:phosphoglycerate kinase, cytosolic-like isoform X1 [Triticum aestivum]|uniref:phosphoglycerate kinase, cytosolic-like isoform X1 n=2 Tax=Triticum aestivum TaxID=4565 RepID=UPI001D018313|nr:phosphoglycerate kinase, cytosolic-like isoform X1 [Triticum aestivum]